MPKAKINDIHMYYETHGVGEPMVLVAGFGADHTTWVEIVDLLKTHYQIILLDNRGAGQTDVPAGAYSIEQMAKDVIALCDYLKIEKAHFVGNSMGGFIVQALAYHFPHRAKSVIISNSVTSGAGCFNVYLAAQLELLKASAPLAAIIKASCSWVFSHSFLAQPGMLDMLVQMTLENPYPFTLAGYEGQYHALNAFNSTAWVDKIKVPALVMGADQDLIFRETAIRQLAEIIPKAEYFCFENCGHLPFVEYPEKFVKRVVDYLSF